MYVVFVKIQVFLKILDNMIAQKKTEAKKGGKINRTQSKRDLA